MLVFVTLDNDIFWFYSLRWQMCVVYGRLNEIFNRFHHLMAHL